MGNWFSGLLRQVIAGQVRTVLAVGGGALLAHGADPEAVGNLQSCLAEPVIGLGLWAVAGLWSAKSKAAAKAEPAAPTFPVNVNQYPK